MIRDDRELLAELARLNRTMVPLAMSIMEGTASADEQRTYAQRLIAAGERLRRRAERTSAAVIVVTAIGEEATGIHFGATPATG